MCIVCIKGYFYNEMHYINLCFTYLLTYLLGVGGLVVWWLGRPTCDQQVTSLTPSHALPG